MLTPDLPESLTFAQSGTPLEAIAETTYTLSAFALDADGDTASLTAWGVRPGSRTGGWAAKKETHGQQDGEVRSPGWQGREDGHAHNKKSKARVHSELGLYFLGPTPWPPSYEEGGMAMGLARVMAIGFLGFMA